MPMLALRLTIGDCLSPSQLEHRFSIRCPSFQCSALKYSSEALPSKTTEQLLLAANAQALTTNLLSVYAQAYISPHSILSLASSCFSKSRN